MTFRRIQRLLCYALLVFLCLGCGNAASRTRSEDNVTSPENSAGPQQLSADGEALLQRSLDAAELPSLRWPNFSNYQKEVKEFYQAFNGTLPWLRQGKLTPQALAIIRSLKNAEYEGMRPEDYDGSRWDGRVAHLDQSPEVTEDNLVEFDLALTVSTMRYISDLHIGRVNPRQFHFDLDIHHMNFDLSEFLREKLVHSNNVDVTLQSVEPPFPIYRRTENALKTYIDLARRDDNELLPVPSNAIKPGGSFAGVPRLGSLLALLGDLPEGYTATANAYRGTIVDGVKHFQLRHGLEPNGWIDAPTVRELNTPLSDRIVQLRLTMERIRWLSHEFERPPIVVNIPEFILHAEDASFHSVLSMNVVVGKAFGHQTPVFASEVKSVIFRPYWDVPRSILLAELLPHLSKDRSYLTENSYQLVDKTGNVLNEGSVNDTILEELRSGDLRVRQIPGPKNALGLVKFVIPSHYDVYMHGTPATELFSRSRRDFSHGCIRVEDPVGLAKWALRDMPAWTEENIRAAMDGDLTEQVKLNKPIPVLILYSTSVVAENGQVYFFRDIYRLDTALEQALVQGVPYSSGAETPAGQ